MSLPKGVLTDKEILISYRNDWRKKLIASSIDQKWAEKKAKVDSDFKETSMETGQILTVWDKIDICKKNKSRALLFVAVIDTLFKMEDNKLLDELWTEEALKINPRPAPKPVIHTP